MVSYGQELMSREKDALSKALLSSIRIKIYALVFLMALPVAKSYFLGRRVPGTINRLSNYAQRIAS